MKKVRWGIVGPGVIAHKFAEAIKNVESAELIAVASTSRERACSFAKEYNIPHCFSSYAEMASSCLIDAVYISTAHPFHFDCAKLFLEAKIPVLCEKPLTVNAKQAKELKKIAAKNDVFLMEAMWTRFLPYFSKLTSLLKAKEIGDIQSITADFCYYIEKEEDPKLFENSLAGGSLLDVGVYCLHFASAILGDPSDFFAEADIENGIDTHTRILLKYPNGNKATLSSAIRLEKPYDAYIYGSEGSIFIPSFYKADSFTVIKNNGEKTDYYFPYGENRFEFEIIEVCSRIAQHKKESSILPLGETIKVIEQMDKIRTLLGISYTCE